VKRQLGEIMSAFEYIDRTAYDMGLQHGLGPLLSADEVGDSQCFVLVETSGGNQDHDLEVLSFSLWPACELILACSRNSTVFWRIY
jgi:hypothetical protein